MLNKNNERELAYVVRINDIKPIQGSDNCECAVVNGWNVMVRKNTLKPGDLAVYFEIDSKLDITKPEFAFLISKKGHIKTQKYTFGGKGSFLSQGLLMPFSDFGWENDKYEEGTFLTKELGITYYEPEDNARKANSVDKYKKMAQRNGKLFRHQPFRWLMRREWGKKLLFVFFGKKRDKCNAWPNHIAKKTDVERIQNMIWILQDKRPYVATEKVDGSSCSIMAERKWWGGIKQYVCSRNVVFDAPDAKCFYDTNIYFEAYEKYDLKTKIVTIMKDLNLPNLAIQMEIFGPGVQKREYGLKEREARVFHMVSNGVKFPMDKTVELCEKYDLPHVAIIDDNYIFPDTIEELQAFVESEGSKIDGEMKEGIVFYDKETGQTYTKFVSPEFLMKYHG